jgi:hypothetical protein
MDLKETSSFFTKKPWLGRAVVIYNCRTRWGSPSPGFQATLCCYAILPQQEQESEIGAEPSVESAPAPPRQRRKKIPATVMEDPELGLNVSLDDSGEASSEKIDAGEGISSVKPKRIRRAEEPRRKR